VVPSSTYVQPRLLALWLTSFRTFSMEPCAYTNLPRANSMRLFQLLLALLRSDLHGQTIMVRSLFRRLAIPAPSALTNPFRMPGVTKLNGSDSISPTIKAPIHSSMAQQSPWH